MGQGKKRKSSDKIARPPKKRQATNTKSSRPTIFEKVRKPCILLSLPAELRNEIYSLALGKDSLILVRKRGTTRRWREPDVLNVCKIIRAEATPIYYGINSFHVTIDMHEFKNVASWIHSQIQLCGLPVFRNLVIYVLGTIWTELDHIVPFLQLIRDVGPKLSKEQEYLLAVPSGRRPTLDEVQAMNNSLVCTKNGYRCNPRADRALHEALPIMELANEEGWSEEWLDFEFHSWLEDKRQSVGLKQGVYWKKYKQRKRLEDGAWLGK